MYKYYIYIYIYIYVYIRSHFGPRQRLSSLLSYCNRKCPGYTLEVVYAQQKSTNNDKTLQLQLLRITRRYQTEASGSRR